MQYLKKFDSDSNVDSKPSFFRNWRLYSFKELLLELQCLAPFIHYLSDLGN